MDFSLDMGASPIYRKSTIDDKLRVEKEDTMEPRLLDHEQFAAICKALGHPARVAIVMHLLQTRQCVCGRIVEILPLAQSTVSQHLKALKEAGLVRGEVDGPRVCYCLDMDLLEKFKKTVEAI